MKRFFEPWSLEPWAAQVCQAMIDAVRLKGSSIECSLAAVLVVEGGHCMCWC